jgi:hypothetical protein
MRKITGLMVTLTAAAALGVCSTRNRRRSLGATDIANKVPASFRAFACRARPAAAGGRSGRSSVSRYSATISAHAILTVKRPHITRLFGAVAQACAW